MVTSPSKAKQNHQVTRAQGISSPLTKRLYTLKEAAHYLGMSVWGLRGLIYGGEIPVVRAKAGRKIYFDIEDLDKFINQNKAVYK